MARPQASISLLSLLLVLSPADVSTAGAQDTFAAPRAQAKKLINRLSADGFHDAAKLCLEPFAALGASEKEIERVREDLDGAANRPAKEEKLDGALKEASRVTQRLLGHADARTTLKHYVHTGLDEMRDAVDRLPSTADQARKVGA